MRISFMLEGTIAGQESQRHFVIPTEADDFGPETQQLAFDHFRDQNNIQGLRFEMSESGLIRLFTPNENLTSQIVADISRRADIALKAAVRDTRRS